MKYQYHLEVSLKLKVIIKRYFYFIFFTFIIFLDPLKANTVHNSALNSTVFIPTSSPAEPWYWLSGSFSGQYLLAGAIGVTPCVYLSNDFGCTYNPVTSVLATNLFGVAVDPSGQFMFAIDYASNGCAYR